MAIFPAQRLFDLVRSNLSSFVERAADWVPTGSVDLERVSDEELAAEIERRRLQRQAEQAERERQSRAQARAESRAGAQGAQSRQSSGRRQSRTTPDLRRLYAQLECPDGADLATVRKHYRRLMRKYHPDLHAGHPDRQRVATDLTQRLTAAYNELRRALT